MSSNNMNTIFNQFKTYASTIKTEFSTLTKRNRELEAENKSLREFKQNALSLFNQMFNDSSIPVVSETTPRTTTQTTTRKTTHTPTTQRQIIFTASDEEEDEDYVPSRSASSDTEWEEEENESKHSTPPTTTRTSTRNPTRTSTRTSSLTTILERAIALGVVTKKTSESARNTKLLNKIGRMVAKRFRNTYNTNPGTKPQYIKRIDKTLPVKAYGSKHFNMMDTVIMDVFAQA